MILDICITPETDSPVIFEAESENNRTFPICYTDIGTIIINSKCIYDKECTEHGSQYLAIGKYSIINENCIFELNNAKAPDRIYQGVIPGDVCSVQVDRHIGGSIMIGNDVRICHDVTVSSNTIIHSGAYITPHSVVTSEIPPYAIAAGNPASVIGYRFSQSQIEKLMEIKWWNWTAEDLKKHSTYMNGNVDSFLEHFHTVLTDTKEDKIHNCRETVKSLRETGQVYLLFSDLSDPFSLTEKVICEFARNFNGLSDTLLLFVDSSSEDYEKHIAKIEHIVQQLSEYDANLFIYSGGEEEAFAAIENVSYYITNRNKNNINRIEGCWLNKTPVISGLQSRIKWQTQWPPAQIPIHNKQNIIKCQGEIQDKMLEDAQEELPEEMDLSIYPPLWDYLSNDGKLTPSYLYVETIPVEGITEFWEQTLKAAEGKNYLIVSFETDNISNIPPSLIKGALLMHNNCVKEKQLTWLIYKSPGLLI